MNLVSTMMQFLTPMITNKIASSLGINNAMATTAINAILPTILAGLAGRAGTPAGDGVCRMVEGHRSIAFSAVLVTWTPPGGHRVDAPSCVSASECLDERGLHQGQLSNAGAAISVEPDPRTLEREPHLRPVMLNPLAALTADDGQLRQWQPCCVDSLSSTHL